MHESFLKVLHTKLMNCPYHFKMIADGIQRYVVATPKERGDIVKDNFSQRDYGEYWKIANQLIQPSCSSIVASILSCKEDRNQAAHELILHFITSQQPVNPDSLVIASMALV